MTGRQRLYTSPTADDGVVRRPTGRNDGHGTDGQRELHPSDGWRPSTKAAMRRAASGYPGRTECEGDVPLNRQVRRRRRQVQDDATDGTDDLNAEFEQPVAQPRHLCAGARGVGGAQPQFLHEHVGCGSQQDAQRVRLELAAARAVELQILDRFSTSPRAQ